MTKRTWLAAILASALAIAVAAPGALAGPGGGRRGMGPRGPRGRAHRRAARLFACLELSADQQQQVKSIRKAHQDDMKAATQAVTEKRQALAEAVLKGDEAAIRQAAALLGAAIADASVLRAKMHAKVTAVLTPEQQAKATELRAQRKARLQERPARPRKPRGAPPIE